MVRMPMIAALVALLVWTGPHTACLVAQPYDGPPALAPSDDEKLKVGLFDFGGGLYQAPDRQSAVACIPPDGQRAS